MTNGASGGGKEPPSWWNVELYSFINENLPLEGWVWEFMRRARLFEIPIEKPVDAMNPNPELDDGDYDYRDYYRPWNHSKWSKKPPVFLPPSVIPSGGWPDGFAGQRYRIDDEDLREMAQFGIDLNRRDKVIVRDFKSVLNKLREEVPQPQKVVPRIKEWLDNHIIEVWDLRQFQVSWFEIARLVGVEFLDEDRYGAIQLVRNSYNTAVLYIEDGRWLNFARYIERVGLLKER